MDLSASLSFDIADGQQLAARRMLNLVVQRQDVVELGRGGVTGICVDSGHVYVVYGNAEIQCLEDRGSKVGDNAHVEFYLQWIFLCVVYGCCVYRGRDGSD